MGCTILNAWWQSWTYQQTNRYTEIFHSSLKNVKLFKNFSKLLWIQQGWVTSDKPAWSQFLGPMAILTAVPSKERSFELEIMYFYYLSSLVLPNASAFDCLFWYNILASKRLKKRPLRIVFCSSAGKLLKSTSPIIQSMFQDILSIIFGSEDINSSK